MLKKRRQAVVILVVVGIIGPFPTFMLPEAAFAFGGAGPTAGLIASPFTQKVVAGESAVYNMTVCAYEFSSFTFNVSAGLAERPKPDPQHLKPLPKGFEAKYPTQFSIPGDGCYSFPLVVKTSSELKDSLVDIQVSIAGSKDGYDWGSTNVRLFVAPLNTPLGTASTVFYEGFDSMSSIWVADNRAGVVRAAGSSPGAQDPKYDYPGISAPNWFMQYPYVSLQLTKNAAGQNVSVERSFPRLNGSFIAEYAMKSYDGKINFTFNLIDSIKNMAIRTELSEGNITVQDRLEGTYQFGIYNEDFFNITLWHKFRLEANATSHVFKLYLDGKYKDTLPFAGSPDSINIEVACPGLCTGYLDDIFLEKITGPITINTTTSSVQPKLNYIALNYVDICISNCTYPAPYLSAGVLVNTTTSPLRSLNVTIDGALASYHAYAGDWTQPTVIAYKSSVAPEVHLTAGRTYNITFTATFENVEKYAASKTVTILDQTNTVTSTTTTQLSPITSTLTTMVTSTTTAISTERVADPSTYAWAISATVAAVVLAAVVVVLSLRRTR